LVASRTPETLELTWISYVLRRMDSSFG
jgi:hypothetical protein